MDNWYEILGVPESVTRSELKHLREKARLEHHPDLYDAAPQAEREWHAAQLKTCLEGVSFLLSEEGPQILKAHLKQQHAAQAKAEAERIRKRNQDEARQRGDADALRQRFGSRSGTARPQATRQSPRPRPAPATTKPIGSLPPRRSTSRVERLLEDVIQGFLNLTHGLANVSMRIVVAAPGRRLVIAVGGLFVISLGALTIIVALHLLNVLLCGQWSCPQQ
jgi:hypothetical protein